MSSGTATTTTTRGGSSVTILPATSVTGPEPDTTKPTTREPLKPVPPSSNTVTTTVSTDQGGGRLTTAIVVPPGPLTKSDTVTISVLTDQKGPSTTVVVLPPTDTDGGRQPQPPTTMSTTTSAKPSQTCADLGNGNFVNGAGTLAPWHISDRVTADSSGVINHDDGRTVFALIPSQTQYSQVYLNQPLPFCGSPPPQVTLRIKFSFQFTGDSQGCQIGATVNRNPTLLVDVHDDGTTPGIWQTYEGDAIQVQLTYDPLFTLRLICDEDTANAPAILIDNISVY